MRGLVWSVALGALSGACAPDVSTSGGQGAPSAMSGDAAPFVDAGRAADAGVGSAATPDAQIVIAPADAGGQPDCGSKLEITVRDFTEQHPDFEKNYVAQQGLVKPELGPDRKPAYAPMGATPASSGPDGFAQWYNDVAGVNMRVPVSIEFTETMPGVFVYASNSFFPIDGMGFGNGPKGLSIPFLGTLPVGVPDHNFLFTTEVHTLFTYKGGERFSFTGDDDLWVFVNGKLAIDLGGTHVATTGTLDMDAQATTLGIRVGDTYPMDIFHAERHTTQSNFRIETTIDFSCIVNVPPIL